MHQSCSKHHMQGVWGAAGPPSGEREGRSPLAISYLRSSGEREGRGPLASTPQRSMSGAGSARGTARAILLIAPAREYQTSNWLLPLLHLDNLADRAG